MIVDIKIPDPEILPEKEIDEEICERLDRLDNPDGEDDLDDEEA